MQISPISIQSLFSFTDKSILLCQVMFSYGFQYLKFILKCFIIPHFSNVIIQWGRSSTVTLSGSANKKETITYPISFSEICWFVASPYNGATDICTMTPSLSSCLINIINITSNTHTNLYAQYIGIGY